MLVNIAYFAAVSKEEMLSSGSVVAAVFFGNMFGQQAEKVMSVFVALSAFGNVLSVIFSQGRSMYFLPSKEYIILTRSRNSCPGAWS
jgi:amino acid transporter